MTWRQSSGRYQSANEIENAFSVYKKVICTQFSGHRVKIESLGFYHGCFPEFGGRHPFCFSLDSAVIVIANILGNRHGEGFKGVIILLKSIEHFIFQSAEEGFHHAIVIAVTLSGHGLNDSVLLKLTTVECVLVLPALI